MIKFIKVSKIFLTLVLVVGLTPMLDGATNPKKAADVSFDSGGITWMPKISYSKLVLNISGPNETYFSKTFENSMAPHFALSSFTEGASDGAYTYELRFIPASVVNRGNRDKASVAAGIRTEKLVVQTGYFRVNGGMIVTSNSVERLSRANDIVHNDDVIIDGSLCVGNDCYSGLAFGFDTIVLMENNLRIFFDDTSTIQNYPRNDWRIVCNDSTDGGGNYFAVQDATEVSNIMVLEAGAPSNSIYVDNYGDVGINTSTPYYELHIVDGDSPCVRLEQDSSYGWTPQKWDVCGNESNFFIRDATHASKLPFRIEPEAPTDSIFIKSNGNVGIGTGSPGASLEVEITGGNASFLLDRTDGATGKMTARPSDVFIGSGSNHNLKLVANNNEAVTIEPGGDVGIGLSNPTYKLHITGGAYCDGGAWMPGSSREYKENIADLTTIEAIEAFKKLKPVKFNYKTNKKEDYIGFIAEDVPQLLATKERKSVSPMDVVAVLTKVVQQQQKVVQEQQKAISELQKKIAELQNKSK